MKLQQLLDKPDEPDNKPIKLNIEDKKLDEINNLLLRKNILAKMKENVDKGDAQAAYKVLDDMKIADTQERMVLLDILIRNLKEETYTAGVFDMRKKIIHDIAIAYNSSTNANHKIQAIKLLIETERDAEKLIDSFLTGEQ